MPRAPRRGGGKSHLSRSPKTMVTEWTDADDWRMVDAIIDSGREVDLTELADHVRHHRRQIPHRVREYIAQALCTYHVPKWGAPRTRFNTHQLIEAVMITARFLEDVENRKKRGERAIDARVDAAKALGMSKSKLERWVTEFFPARKN